ARRDTTRRRSVDHAPPRRRAHRRPLRTSPVAGPHQAAAAISVQLCPASPATDPATSPRNRPGPAETIDGPRRRRHRALALEALVNAPAAAGATRTFVRTPSLRHK